MDPGTNLQVAYPPYPPVSSTRDGPWLGQGAALPRSAGRLRGPW